MAEAGDPPSGKPLGSITLRTVRVPRADAEAVARPANPMNRLVPYLDLFARLSDAELARLAVVPPDVVAQLRQQVVQVEQALSRWVDLLPRLEDDELIRLTGASAKTIRFWRLCQPRAASMESLAGGRTERARAPTAPQPVVTDVTPPAGNHPTPRPTPPTRSPTPAPTTMPASTPAPAAAGVPYPTPTPAAPSGPLEILGAPFPGQEYDREAARAEEGLEVGLDLEAGR